MNDLAGCGRDLNLVSPECILRVIPPSQNAAGRGRCLHLPLGSEVSDEKCLSC